MEYTKEILFRGRDAIRMGRAEAKHASQADEVLYGGDAIRMGRAEAKASFCAEIEEKPGCNPHEMC